MKPHRCLIISVGCFLNFIRYIRTNQRAISSGTDYVTFICSHICCVLEEGVTFAGKLTSLILLFFSDPEIFTAILSHGDTVVRVFSSSAAYIGVADSETGYL
jgi:hypothetical protein